MNSEAAIVLDTSGLIAYFAGNGKLDEVIRDALLADRVFIPLIVVAELLSGTSSEKVEPDLMTFLDSCNLITADTEHWISVGRLRRHLSKKGVTLTIPDAHILQCAIELGGELLTYDGVFKAAVKFVPVKLAKLV